MRTLFKIMLVVAVAIGLTYHMAWYRGYYAVGAEVFVPIILAILLLGGGADDKKKKRCRSNR